ncbi:FecCD family ABC transporter permease [Paenibacillus koleovorans]|uniref:FecCD family ABC transporter permease n=1 Tax=Paenibacillus koleovorans TaxID=121608 RepID=UPI000FDC6013|nr:iron ABC transporter permease [Paenibacillus koleovorans]
MRNHETLRFWSVLTVIGALIVVVFYISLTNGVFDIGLLDIAKTLLRIYPSDDYDLVIFDFRLPRIVISLLVGFGLAIAGTVMQGVTRNGLADPGILGINAGAGAAIVTFMFFFAGKMTGTGLLAILAMPLFGLAGGLLAAISIYALAWRNGQLDPRSLLLTGIAIGSGFGAISLYLSLKMNARDFEMAAVWLTGSIWNANWIFIASMLPWLLLLTPIVLWKAYALDLLRLGEPTAQGLGLAAEREKRLLLLASIGIVSACVSVSGSIGFVGLIAPHIAKRLVGIHHRHVLPVSGAIGMLLVAASDFIAKTVFHPVELPVGIVISIIGVPYFVYLLYKRKA